jgi:hypothetical protein
MDGKKLTRLVLDALDELQVENNFASQRKIYENLEWAAMLFLRETRAFRKTMTIATVIGQQIYDLTPDFISLYMKNPQQRFFIKYSDGTNDSFPTETSYEKIYKQNVADQKTIPNRFALRVKETLGNPQVVIAEADGAKSGGQCQLESSPLNSALIKPRDIVHNLTDNSDGFVLQINTATKVTVALFDGTNDDVSSLDDLVLVPSARQQIVLDAPSAVGDHTISIPYVALPSPVFSEYSQWELEAKACRAIAWGAASLFKMPQNQFGEAQAIGGFFADEIRRYRNEMATQALHQRRYRSAY